MSFHVKEEKGWDDVLLVKFGVHFTVKYMWNIRIIHSAVNGTLQSHIRFGFLVGALFTLQEENLSFQLKSSSIFFFLSFGILYV